MNQSQTKKFCKKRLTAAVGLFVGDAEGRAVGLEDGNKVGLIDIATLGLSEGEDEGNVVGLFVDGACVGLEEGKFV